MKMKKNSISHVVALAFVCTPHLAYSEQVASNWKMHRLLHPTQADLVSERKGKIIIYDRLTENTVDKALDENFDRIGAMMFTRTVLVDEAGNPLRDPVTGELITENDGCD